MFMNISGRCSIVSFSGDVLCDIYARPAEPITDYRTPWSGIRKADLAHALPFDKARHHIENILKVRTAHPHASDYISPNAPKHIACKFSQLNLI